MPCLPASPAPSLAALFLAGACLADLWRACPERSLGETFSEALKTSLLEPFLIATQTTVANAQLSQNQQHPDF
jgi:hypothetical protein